MPDHHTRSRTAAVSAAGAAASLAAVLAFGHVGDAFAAMLPDSHAVVAIGGATNPTSDRVDNKFGGQYVPYRDEFVEPAEGRFYGVNYPASLPVNPSVAAARQPLIDTVTAARDTIGAGGTIYIVSYSEGTIVGENYKRELAAGTVPPPGDVQFVSIASPTVPNGGIYARFPNLNLFGFTSTGAAAVSPYDETFLTIEYDPVGDFPAYANPLSLANAALGFYYLHGDETPDATDLNDPDAVTVTQISTPEGGTDTYILVRTENLPLLQPIRDISQALQTEAFTEPVLDAIEPTLKLLVDMGYTDRDYSDPATPTRFSLFTPRERILDTLDRLPDALRPDTGGETVPQTVPEPAAEPVTEPVTPGVAATPVTRAPAERLDAIRERATTATRTATGTPRRTVETGSETRSQRAVGPRHDTKSTRAVRQATSTPKAKATSKATSTPKATGKKSTRRSADKAA